MDFEQDGVSLRCIAPFADMFNHAPGTPIVHLLDKTTQRLRIVANRNYEVGKQVKSL